MTEKEYKEVVKMLKGRQRTTFIYTFIGFTIGIFLAIAAFNLWA